MKLDRKTFDELARFAAVCKAQSPITGVRAVFDRVHDRELRLTHDKMAALLDAARLTIEAEEAEAARLEAYRQRAEPRLAAIDALSTRIDFSSPSWRYTPEGERWNRLMNEQAADEQAMGL